MLISHITLPNAGHERRPTGRNAANTLKHYAVGRPLQAVVRGFGGCAATHLKGTVPAHPFLAILTSTPWVVVTVPALVLCARL